MLEGLNEILRKNLEVLSVQYLFVLTSVTVLYHCFSTFDYFNSSH